MNSIVYGNVAVNCATQCCIVGGSVWTRVYDFPIIIAKCTTEMEKCHIILSEKFTED